MYDELVERLRHEAAFAYLGEGEDGKKLKRLTEEAADAIEELLSERDEVNADSWKRAFEVERDEHRWIPVTEQLIHSGWYLVACNEWGGSAVRKAIYDEATRKWMEFPCRGPKDITKLVTHYTPLPEPPKEET